MRKLFESKISNNSLRVAHATNTIRRRIKDIEEIRYLRLKCGLHECDLVYEKFCVTVYKPGGQVRFNLTVYVLHDVYNIKLSLTSIRKP